jgi:Tol biopolymer transport system component
MKPIKPVAAVVSACVIAVTLSAPPAEATYQGQPGRITFGAFDTTDRSQADIWSVNQNGKHPHRLTDAPGRDICPAYSADGRSIAFCSDRTGSFEIWVMDANGNHERQVTQLQTYAVFPDFSPDGSRLVFSAEPDGGGNTDLWVVPADGGDPTQLTHTTDMLEENPVWSPDGSTVLFVRIAGDFSSGQLWTMDVTTGQETQLTFDATFKDQTPDWSPDGAHIAYAADDDIWLMDANGSGQTNLTHSPDVEFGAAYSPDGTRLAFTGSGGRVPAGERYVQTMDLDGSQRRVLSPTPGLLQAVPAWQPLGAR